jgi:hypothetical protein
MRLGRRLSLSPASIACFHRLSVDLDTRPEILGVWAAPSI